MDTNSINSLVVLARKYNDIFYSISTEEWSKSKMRVLIILPYRSAAETFPLKHLFDKVVVLPSENFMSSVKNLIFLKRIKTLLHDIKGDVITMSNPGMLTNRIIFKMTRCEKILFMEDGLMNYHHYKANHSLLKQTISYIFGVNDSKYFDRISKTYLTNPQLAKYYFGEKSKLTIKTDWNVTMRTPNLSHKKILIAQDLVSSNPNSDFNYYNFINKIIKQYNIDYYVPRTHDFDESLIQCETLNINNYGITLEILSRYYDFEIFGFSTTLLFSTKNINPNITTHRISSVETKNLIIPEILNINCDKLEYL